MNQQINLYQPIFRKQPKVFSALTILQAVLAVAVGLMLIYAYGRWQDIKLSRALSELKAQRTASLNRVQLLAEKYPSRTKSPLLEQEVQRLAAERDATLRILTALSGKTPGNTTGFSAFLEGLAHEHIDGLWLTDFAIGNGGADITLAGSALRPQLVPRYLQKLSLERAFTGKAFKSLLMTRPKTGPTRIDFFLRTKTEPNTEGRHAR